jgi:DNA repair exonuclease SbcCD ATPase subunit
MEKLKSSKAIAVVTTALFVASLVWLMNTKSVNSSLEAGLQEQKLKSEALLSEKLLLEKDIQKFKDQLSKLKDENVELDNLFKNTSAKLQTQESEYNRMKRENTSLAQIKRQRQELQELKNQLENELTLLKTSYASLEAKNSELNNTVVALQERNKVLTDDLNRAMFAAVDQSQIQAVRGNSEKLTVKARRTKKLIANFEVPANLKALSFRITDSKGNILTTDQGNIAFTSVPSEKSLTASSDSESTGSKLQKVEMAYIPKQKLKTGVYTVEILNESLYVGSLKVKLK